MVLRAARDHLAGSLRQLAMVHGFCVLHHAATRLIYFCSSFSERSVEGQGRSGAFIAMHSVNIESYRTYLAASSSAAARIGNALGCSAHAGLEWLPTDHAILHGRPSARSSQPGSLMSRDSAEAAHNRTGRGGL